MFRFNFFVLRDYLLDKAKEKEKKEADAKLDITIKTQAYVGDNVVSTAGVILGQYHVPLKDFSDVFTKLSYPYNNDVLLNLKIKKKLILKEFDIVSIFCNIGFLVYQIIKVENYEKNQFILILNKVEFFDLIKLYMKLFQVSLDYAKAVLFGYLETISKGRKFITVRFI